jgi:hypothetical protein
MTEKPTWGATVDSEHKCSADSSRSPGHTHSDTGSQRTKRKSQVRDTDVRRTSTVYLHVPDPLVLFLINPPNHAKNWGYWSHFTDEETEVQKRKIRYLWTQNKRETFPCISA